MKYEDFEGLSLPMALLKWELLLSIEQELWKIVEEHCVILPSEDNT